MTLRLLSSFVTLLLLGSCLRPMQERAERDREVGVSQVGSARFDVDGGLACVRDMSDERIWIWAGAPTLQGRLSAPANREWTMEVHNTLPDAVLAVSTPAGQAISVTLVDAPLPTRKIWRFSLGAEEVVDWTIAPADAGVSGPYTFAVLSDVQEAIDRVGDIYALMNEDNELRFVLGAGDLTRRGSEEELREFQRHLEALRIPYYTTLGNHELGTTPAPWHDYFGRASFHFTFRGVHYSMVDSGSASIDPIVYEWLDDWLSASRDAVHIFAMHIPPVDPIGVRNGSFGSRNEAAKLLARLGAAGVDLTLYGHIHSYYEFENAGIRAHISGGGGAIPERFDRIGRHYLVVDVDSEVGVTDTRVVRVD